MRRSGTVAAINPSRGMVAIATEDDRYTIIELLSEFELEVGDEMDLGEPSWPWIRDLREPYQRRTPRGTKDNNDSRRKTQSHTDKG